MTQLLIAFFLLFSQLLAPAGAAEISLLRSEATLGFPEQITFQADLQAAEEITRVVLEYRLPGQTTCGTVISKAFPDFTPAKSVSVSWTWEMRQSGSLPPGAEIAWRWRVTDASGKETLTEEQSIVWIDTEHNWQSIQKDGIALYYYDRSQSEANELHQAAVDALQRLESDIGFDFQEMIMLFIYANSQEMKNAVLYEPGWTGGQAYAAHRVIIIGIEPSQWEWGLNTEAHELSHVLIGQLTFSCLGDIPTWLDEGLAMYSEGGPSPAEISRFEKAVTEDAIFSIRSLSGGFSEDSEQANLSYSQSYSVVNFLLKAYPTQHMLDMLQLLRSGETIDKSLQAAYGFADTESLEDAWRANIGARPRLPDSNEQATPTPTATLVPTMQPIDSGQSLATPIPTSASALATAQPTLPLPQPQPTAPSPLAVESKGQSISPLVYAAVVLGVLVVAIILLFLVRRRRNR